MSRPASVVKLTAKLDCKDMTWLKEGERYLLTLVNDPGAAYHMEAILIEPDSFLGFDVSAVPTLYTVKEVAPDAKPK